MKTAISAEPAPAEPESTLLSKHLQDKGVSLNRIAVSMLGYKALSGYDSVNNESSGESYLLSAYGDGATSVTRDSESGVDIAHVPFGLKGLYAFNAVDFLLAHDEKLAGPQEAVKAIRAAFKLEDDIAKPHLAVVASEAPVSPKEAATAIYAPASPPANVTVLPVAAVVREPEAQAVTVPREMDITYVMSRDLQNQGASLTSIATGMFGFDTHKSWDSNESYIYHGSSFIAAVTPNNDGLQVAHYIDPVDGRNQVCAVRFAMQHGNFKSPLAAYAAVKQHFAKPSVV